MLFIVRCATPLLVLAKVRPGLKVTDRVSLIEASRATLGSVAVMTFAGLVVAFAVALTSPSSSATRSLAVAVMGGMAVAWYVTLFVVPSLYLLLGELRDGAAAWSVVRAGSVGSFEPAD